MNDPLAVYVLDRLGDRLEYSKGFRCGQRTPGDSVHEQLAVYILHDDARPSVNLLKVIEGRNVRMVEARLDAGLVVKALDEPLGGSLLGEHLDGDDSPDLRVNRAVDFTHSSSADEVY